LHHNWSDRQSITAATTNALAASSLHWEKIWQKVSSACGILNSGLLKGTQHIFDFKVGFRYYLNNKKGVYFTGQYSLIYIYYLYLILSFVYCLHKKYFLNIKYEKYNTIQ